jgi:hypothetical protein
MVGRRGGGPCWRRAPRPRPNGGAGSSHPQRRPISHLEASNLDPFDLERAIPSVGADHVVCPVWFATNRKPAVQGGSFTGERHDRLTRGRVEVFVPQAHRFGETGAGFWRRLLRFDLRDDRLRLQHVETQERDAFFTDIRSAMLAAAEDGEQPQALFFFARLQREL